MKNITDPIRKANNKLSFTRIKIHEPESTIPEKYFDEAAKMIKSRRKIKESKKWAIKVGRDQFAPCEYYRAIYEVMGYEIDHVSTNHALSFFEHHYYRIIRKAEDK